MLAELRISQRALRRNLQTLQAFAGGGRVMSVVKANGYGHGLAAVSRSVKDLTDAYGVYEIDEGIELRELGLSQPIHILGPVHPSDFERAINAELTLPIWNQTAWLSDLRRAARQASKRARVQIKVDSGLSRLGIDPAKALDLLTVLQTEERFEVRGGYSHLAAAEELDSRYTLEQLAHFERALPAGSVPERHIAASAAALLWPQTRLDLMRFGIALYGIWPSDDTQTRLSRELTLEPALSWCSEIVAVQDVAAEAPLGYGCTYRPPFATRIGILPIGYAEGLPRLLSNRGEVIVKGELCAIVGRICMNMAFIDLTSAPSAGVGSTVTICGTDGNTTIRPEDLGRAAQTIGYEIVARLPREIPRRLVD